MKLILFFFLFLISYNTFSQNIINGRITDSLGNSIAGVSIKSLKNGKIAAFALSDRSGNYNLNTDSQITVVNIEISHIGFTTINKTVKNFSQTQNFILRQSVFLLPIVKIKSSAIIKKGDTVVYDPRVFAGKQDRAIGDVIRKLPGIQVDATGQISYNGKPISHYYIDGLDMLEGGYNLANDNIQFNDVDKVQILENHQDKRILDSSESGRSPALNIKLNTSAKNKLIGTINIAGGYEKNILYHTAFSAMQFGSNIQFLHGLKLNNNGTNIAKELTDHVLKSDDFAEPRLPEQKQDLLNISKSSPPAIDEQNYFFNKSMLGYTNALFAINKTTQLKYNIAYLNENLSSNSITSTTFYLPADTIKISENQNSKSIQNLLKVNLKYIKNASGIYLSNNIKIMADWNSENAFIANGNNSKQNLKNPFYQFINDLALYKKVGKRLVQLKSYTAIKNTPQNLQVVPGQFPDFFNNSYRYDILTQYAVKNQFIFNNSASVSSYLLHFQQKYKLITEYKSSCLKSHLEKVNNSFVSVLNNSFKNQFKQKEFKIMPLLELSYYKTKYKINLALPLTILFLDRSDIFHSYINAKNSFVFFIPNFNISRELGNYCEVGLNAEIQKNYSEIDRNTQGYLLSNYRTITKNDTLLYVYQNKTIGTSVSYRNVLKGIFSSLYIFYTEKKNNIIYNQNYTDILQTKVAVQFINKEKTQSIILTAGKYFSDIKSNFNFNFNLFNFKSLVYQNGILQPVNNNNVSLSGKFTCKRISKIYIENNTIFSKSKLTSGESLFSNKYTYINSSLSCYYFINAAFTVSSDAHYYFTANATINKQNYYFLNTAVSYKKKQYEFIIKIKNITNNQQFIQHSIIQNSIIQSSYNLRPHSIVFQYNFKLN